jgi:hypothetical protein
MLFFKALLNNLQGLIEQNKGQGKNSTLVALRHPRQRGTGKVKGTRKRIHPLPLGNTPDFAPAGDRQGERCKVKGERNNLLTFKIVLLILPSIRSNVLSNGKKMKQKGKL